MYEKPTSTFAKRLYEAIKNRGVSSAEVARRTNISSAAISRYLRGDYTPKQDKMYQLARYLRVNPAWLMGYDVPENQKEALMTATAKEAQNSRNIDMVEDKMQELINILSAMKDDITLLSPLEKGLVAKLRQLPREQQIAVKATIDSMYALVQQNAPSTANGEGES